MDDLLFLQEYLASCSKAEADEIRRLAGSSLHLKSLSNACFRTHSDGTVLYNRHGEVCERPTFEYFTEAFLGTEEKTLYLLFRIETDALPRSARLRTLNFGQFPNLYAAFFKTDDIAEISLDPDDPAVKDTEPFLPYICAESSFDHCPCTRSFGDIFEMSPIKRLFDLFRKVTPHLSKTTSYASLLDPSVEPLVRKLVDAKMLSDVTLEDILKKTSMHQPRARL